MAGEASTSGLVEGARYEETGEWAERLDAVIGDSVSRGRISLEEGYEGLTDGHVLELANDCGASIIVTPTAY